MGIGSGTGTRTGLSWTKEHGDMLSSKSITSATLQSAGKRLSLHDSVIDVLVDHLLLAELAHNKLSASSYTASNGQTWKHVKPSLGQVN